MTDQNILIMMRGLPGSGKSTQAKRTAYEFIESGVDSVAICSTDSYHYVDGKYVYQPENIAEYHTQNQDRVRDLMSVDVKVVIVDNTNIRREHMEPYEKLAKTYGYEVVEIVTSDLRHRHGKTLEEYVELCAERNTHKVPRKTILKMAEEFEV